MKKYQKDNSERRSVREATLSPALECRSGNDIRWRFLRTLPGETGACGTGSPSNSSRRSQDDRALRRQHAAIAVSDRGLAIGDLTGTGFAAQLPHRLDQQEQPVHAGVAIG